MTKKTVRELDQTMRLVVVASESRKTHRQENIECTTME